MIRQKQSTGQAERETMRIDRAMKQQRMGFAAAGVTLAALLMSGCNAIGPNVEKTGTAALKGSLHGGQQAISGATIQIYTVGTTGTGSASTAITGASTTSNSAGGFGFAAGSYNCTGATQVYIVATGGNSGAGVNSSITMMASLGSCSTLLANASTTFISINELTTVAAVYALSPFMLDYTHVGANGANAVGLVNAMATSALLANTSNGSIPGATVPAGATVPTAELNTLADIIATCINTSSPSSSNCNTLYGATGATETIGAMLAIAKNPGSPTITALYSLPSAAAPFQPTLSGSSAPADFSVAVKYTANGSLATPYGIAIDAAGNAWVTNEGGSAVTELSGTGAVLSTNSVTGLTGAKGIAIDPTGNVWVANTAGDSVVKLTVSSGAVSGANSFLAGAGNAPYALALDSAGNAWVANFNTSSVTELSGTGSVLLSGLNGSSTILAPTGVAIDSKANGGNVYVASSGTGKVVKLTHAGAVVTGSPFTDNALQSATGITLDASGNVWMAGATTGAAIAGAVSEYTSTGTAVAASPLSGSSTLLGSATADTVSVWVANRSASGGLLQYQASATAPVSPAAGFGSLNGAVGVAVDPSGNVWTANSGDNTVSQFVGLGKPVTTPISANVGP